MLACLGPGRGQESEKRGSGSRPRFSRIPCREPMSVWLIPDSHLLWERLLYRMKAVDWVEIDKSRLPWFIIENSMRRREVCKPSVSRSSTLRHGPDLLRARDPRAASAGATLARRADGPIRRHPATGRARRLHLAGLQTRHDTRLAAGQPARLGYATHRAASCRFPGNHDPEPEAHVA
jgi:hypothetical protein